ncbi:hypothetical protein N0V91_009655 [Didymella pomorum]|uniref:NAD(P)-binding domain-containing protein n=1 Tax=Didymella pomorum TaxID=749634 RepID=A0A9W8Z6S8_9PLEO|nr:hypothetical protein N0V91_009655 [Didymella pomorum]
MVEIVGAGGQMGKHLTEHLLARGQHIITAITRPASTSKLPDCVNVVQIDYTSKYEKDAAALVDALRGQQVLLVTMSHKALSTTKLIVRAAATAQVPYILPNSFGRDAANTQLISDSLMSGL